MAFCSEATASPRQMEINRPSTSNAVTQSVNHRDEPPPYQAQAIIRAVDETVDLIYQKKKSTVKLLSCIRLVVGLIITTLGITVMANNGILQSWVSSAGFGIWTGFLIILSGLLGIATVLNDKSITLGNWHAVLTILSMFLSFASFICFCIGLPHFSNHLNDSAFHHTRCRIKDYYHQFASPDPIVLSCIRMSMANAYNKTVLYILLMLFCLIEIVLACKSYNSRLSGTVSAGLENARRYIGSQLQRLGSAFGSIDYQRNLVRTQDTYDYSRLCPGEGRGELPCTLNVGASSAESQFPGPTNTVMNYQHQPNQMVMVPQGYYLAKITPEMGLSREQGQNNTPEYAALSTTLSRT